MNLLRRRDTEALVAGTRVEDDPALDPVDSFLDTMRTEFGATTAPEPRPTLAATLDGRRPLRPAAGPVVRPTFPEPRPRRRFAKPAAVVAATGAVLFGGLATAGALPGPVQRTTAELGTRIGIHLPGAPEAEPSVRVRVDPGRGADVDVDGVPGRDRAPDPPTPVPDVPDVAPLPPAPTVPGVPGTSPVPAPALSEVPLPIPLPELVPGSGGGPAPSLPLVGPTGPQGPTGPGPVRSLIDQLLP